MANLSRRSFIKLAGLALAGAAFPRVPAPRGHSPSVTERASFRTMAGGFDQSLPPMRRSRDIEDVVAFFAATGQGAGKLPE